MSGGLIVGLMIVLLIVFGLSVGLFLVLDFSFLKMLQSMTHDILLKFSFKHSTLNQIKRHTISVQDEYNLRVYSNSRI